MNDLSPQWLLLDVPSAGSAGETLQRSFAHVRRFYLFDDTEFHALRDEGPVLIDLRTCPALAALCSAEAYVWRGLLLVSEASSTQLLEHLRRMLTVTVERHHRALLSFYNPHTASYFFDACDADQLSRWLGPISQLRWFGGTWADRAIGSQGWQQLNNPGLAVAPLAIEENLTERQRANLQTCLLQHHAWHWSASTGTDYDSLWSHVEEGLALGFCDRSVLDGWLWLRLQYPHALPAKMLSGLTPQERLDSLRFLWQHTRL